MFIYWNLSDRRQVLLRSLSAMTTSMRHPHSETTLGEQIVDVSVLQDVIEDFIKDQRSNADARIEAVE